MGKTLIIVGLVVVLIGVILTWAPGALSWFGRLPGDIRVERGNTRFYFPITSMILVSVILTLLFNLILRK